MRLWSLHPRYLDPQGLVALWREALLARAVLRGETRGYTRHPQLERFQAHAQPRSAINAYLAAVHDEAARRGYAFDRTKIGPLRAVAPIGVADGRTSRIPPKPETARSPADDTSHGRSPGRPRGRRPPGGA